MRHSLFRVLVLVAALSLVLAGCATTNRAAMNRSLYVDQHPDLPEMVADAILSGQIMVGMTDEMVEVAWGKPVRVETVVAEDATTRWTYGNIFMGGNITSLFFTPQGTLVRYEVNYQQAHANSGTVSDKKEVPRGTLTEAGLLTKESGQP